MCRATTTRAFAELDDRRYRRCDRCEATFLASPLPSADAERREYELHQNRIDDAGYRRFLSKVADPLVERLAPASEGLDYGCGPGPALAAMLRAHGHRVAVYDVFFAPDPAPLSATYDFVTATETIEHFHHPASEFERLDRLLRPGGWLAISTCFQTEDRRFADWHYRRDPTHVVFYRAATLRHLARDHGWSLEIPREDVALMQKRLPARSPRRRPR